MDAFFEFLSKNDVEYKREVNIKEYTSIRIGGTVAAIAFPNTADKLIMLIDEVNHRNFPYKIIGRMTNILPRDEYYNGVLISTSRFCGYTISEDKIVADCGVGINKMIYSALRLGLGGAETLAGIPGSIGGMIRTNAGAFGNSISDFLVGAYLYYPHNSDTVFATASDLKLGYRTSILCDIDACVLRVELRFSPKDEKSVRSDIIKFKKMRRETQPYQPSLGSVFKRCDNLSAGKLIDDCGLKGYRVGDAEISKKHAGFIVNVGAATADDYITLIEYCKRCVFEKFGIVLEEEIELL